MEANHIQCQLGGCVPENSAGRFAHKNPARDVNLWRDSGPEMLNR